MGNTVDTKKTVYVPPPAPKKTPDATAPKKALAKPPVDSFETAPPSKSTPEQAAWKAYDKHIKNGPPKASDYRNGPLFQEARKEYNDTTQRLGDAASKASVERLRKEVAATPGRGNTFQHLDNRGVQVKVLDDKSYSDLPNAAKEGHLTPGGPIYIPRSQATKENLLRYADSSASTQPLSLPQNAKDGPKIAAAIAQRLDANPRQPVEFTDSSGIKIVALKNPQPSVVSVAEDKELTSTAQDIGKQPGHDTIINTNFYEGHYLDPRYIGKVRPVNGQVVEDGKVKAGSSQPEKFYAAWTPRGIEFGEGNPPSDSKVGFGGAVPLIINKERYDSDNKNGLKEDLDFKSQEEREASTGKTIVAHDRDTGVTYVVVQEDGQPGKKLSAVRDALAKLGIDDAVAFDGSNSSTLVRDTKVEAKPDDIIKDDQIPYGLNLRVS
ncbi:hypothetical protein MYSTI_05653 [Myxococcus stipitatus DSM 14675]|uniref:Phosphodiester glycosidase domain-containing protein n=1 Tax=Myxococcus stipitatus (strain DSM 14675 / JCM 12634 / Mx s8) TaxID=1278073 RepID=L7UGF3_MYXSD|nr:phosphodiester glycosidase family protein [Myxococcus stipitatus]AGC46930.1 hypothetical protein MYSTI_05653 [Myxococcus stipitatus DSM 14675]